jgi:hypothetical protein
MADNIPPKKQGMPKRRKQYISNFGFREQERLGQVRQRQDQQ